MYHRTTYLDLHDLFDFTEETASSPTAAILIISCLLTGLGVYDKIAQRAGAGTVVPIQIRQYHVLGGNRTSQWGYVLGVGGNMFKLSGSVIVFGVFSLCCSYY